jgi:C-terminal processing protease CtpA/Prc
MNTSFGIRVTDVADDSPADEAGLKAGDVLVKINDETVSAPSDVREIISDYESGDTVTVEVIRKGMKEKFDVKLDDRSFDINMNGEHWDSMKNFDIKVPDFKGPDFDSQFNFPTDFDSKFEWKMDNFGKKIEKQMEDLEQKIESHIENIHITTSI